MDKQGFTAYLQGKNLAGTTITENIRCVERFFAQAQKEDLQITKPDILKYLEYLKNKKGLQNTSRRHNLDNLRRYFTFLQQNGQISKNPCALLKIRGQKRKTLCHIYTPEELDALFDSYYHLFIRNYDDCHIPKNQRQRTALSKDRNAAMLSVLINQGATVGEIQAMETGDIDLIKATLNIRGGQHSNERTVPLKASQIGLFINYLQNIRPQLLEYQTAESDKLFLLLPFGSRKRTGSKKMNNAFMLFANQIKTFDKQFLNFTQIRSSVISFWLKTQGLRKAQYLAGHRYISSTEKYLPNNLDNLIDDINKMHPF